MAFLPTPGAPLPCSPFRWPARPALCGAPGAVRCALSTPLQKIAAAVAASAVLLAFNPGAAAPFALPLPGVHYHNYHNVPAAAKRAAADGDHAVVREVLRTVRRYYLDRGAAAGLEAAEARLEATELRGREEAYRAVRRVLRALKDPYTRFLSPADMHRLSKFDVSGVGLLLTADPNGAMVVAAPPELDSPAGRAGIGKGDMVLRVNGVELAGRSAFEAAELMQGDEHSLMTVDVLKPGTPEPFSYELTRRFTAPSPVSYRLLEVPAPKDSARAEGPSEQGMMKIGYVRLKEFNASCRLAVEHALDSLEMSHPVGYILDLRSNPGGVFEGALEIAGLFFGDSRTVAHVINAEGAVEDFVSRTVAHEKQYTAVPRSTPLVVLLDRMSASSSEVLAGALHDNCRAVIAGGRSYGKGLIQGVFGISDGSGVIVTVAKYRTPSGLEIDGIGITPDLVKDDGIWGLVKGALGLQRPVPAIDWNDVRHRLEMCEVEAVA